MYTQYLYMYNIINYVCIRKYTAGSNAMTTTFGGRFRKKVTAVWELWEKHVIDRFFFHIVLHNVCRVPCIYLPVCVYTLLNSCSRFCVNSLLLSPRCPPRNRLAVCPSAVNCFSSVQPFQNRKKPVAGTRLHHRAQIVVCYPDKSNQEQNFAGFSWENHTD